MAGNSTFVSGTIVVEPGRTEANSKVVEGLIVSAPGVLVALIAVVLTHVFTSRREAAMQNSQVKESLRREGVELSETLRREAQLRSEVIRQQNVARLLSALEKLAEASVGMNNDLMRMRNDILKPPARDDDYDKSEKIAHALVYIYFSKMIFEEWIALHVAYSVCQKSLLVIGTVKSEMAVFDAESELLAQDDPARQTRVRPTIVESSTISAEKYKLFLRAQSEFLDKLSRVSADLMADHSTADAATV